MRIECPGCGAPCEIDAQYIGKKTQCPECGNDFTVVNPNLVPCPDCFAEISKHAQVCPHCGAVLKGRSLHHGEESSSFAAPGNGSDEKEIMVCHPSTIFYLWDIIFGAITIPIVVGIFILLRVWIKVHFTSYTITSLRIVVRHGWIAREQNEIWIKDMRGANLAQGMWQRIIGVGNISIGTAATAGTEICMTGIADPQKVVDQINALRNNA